MNEQETIQISREGSVANIALNRPCVHHAMNLQMVRELSRAFSSLGQDHEIRIVLLRAPGKHFSAGADLHWMQESLLQTREQIEKESRELAGLFRLITEIPTMVISAVQGKSLGGAIGLLAASDLVIAEQSALFGFPEVKLGLVPATIAPYVIRKSGVSKAGAWMFTGRTFGAEEAQSAGLVHFLCAGGALEETASELVAELLSGGPEALKSVKLMLQDYVPGQDPDRTLEESASLIARLRNSAEGQEGMHSFFEKRRPNWNDTPKFS